tara:strand:+ start:2685 stop:5882 length:3198 start_codon:yes stop_codon:yes gene_type:complete
MSKPILLFFILFSLNIHAQSGVIQGTVQDGNGEPLWGSNVYLLGTPLGASTDSAGYYKIENIPINKYTLVCDYIGYRSEEKSIYISEFDIEEDDQSEQSYLEKIGLEEGGDDSDLEILKGKNLGKVDFILEEDVFNSQEVVVTGVASERSVEVSEVAVTRLKPRKFNESTSYTDFGSLLMAKVSGLDIRKASGTVGGGFRFDMRAGGGLNGNEQPVVYIDGMRVVNDEIGGAGSNALTTGGQGISTLLDFNPDDIENIEILKGPAAATSYGTNGSNGVVFIETKKGNAGQDGPVFNYKQTTGRNSPQFSVDKGFQNRDLFHSLLSDGAIRDNYFSMSGGDYTFRHFISLSRRHEEGMVMWKDKNYFDRNTLRANFDIIPKDNLTLSLNTSYSTIDATMPPSDNHIYSVSYNTLVAYNPWQESDSASISQLGINFKTKRLISSASIKYYPFSNVYRFGLNTFQLHAKLGFDDAERHNSNLFPAGYNYALFNSGTKALEKTNERNTILDLGAAHNYRIGQIISTSSLSAQFFDRKWEGVEIARDSFGQNAVTDIGSGSNITVAGEWIGNSRDAGAILTQEMSFLDQYFLTLSYRKDYSSALGSSSRSIGYPGVRFSTRLDKFDFIPGQFQMLKFRAAYGESGVLPAHTDGQNLLWSGSVGGNGSGAMISGVGNPDIEPERIKELEWGLDMTWGNLFSLEISSYQQWAENSVIYRPLSPSLGYGNLSKPDNIGSMEMEGFEALLRASPIRKKDLNVNLSLSYSWNDNTIKKMGDPVFDNYGLVTIREGYPKYSLWGQKVTGSRIDTFNLALLGLDGSIPYFDPLNGFLLEDEGFIDRLVPEHTGNFSVNVDYKLFDFFMLFERKTGFSTAVGGMWWATGPNNNGHTGWLSSMQKLGLDGLFASLNAIPIEMTRQVTPIISEEEVVGTIDYNVYEATGGAVILPIAIPGREEEWANTTNEFAQAHPGFSSNYAEDGSFTRLREVSFGVKLDRYLPLLKLDNAISGLRIFASANNVKLWRPKGTVGVDPELNMSGAITGPIGTTGTGYRSVEVHTMPYPTTYNFGLNIRF